MGEPAKYDMDATTAMVEDGYETPYHQDNVILKLTLAFSIKLIEFTEMLEATKKYVVAKQLLSSGTSIGANVREAQNAESKADFIHKMKIALKELDETEYWLTICEEAPSYPTPAGLFEQLLPIRKILTKIIHTSKRNN